MLQLEENPIIAAVHTRDDFDAALKSELKVIFLLSANIITLQEYARTAHKNGKMLFVHADMAEGISRDSYGIDFMASVGADGIISTRGNIIKMAKECSIKTVQRFFMIDAHSIDTAIDSVKSQRPDMIEIMPGIMPKVISRFAAQVKVPIITGGLIETKQEIIEALKSGATAVSTSKQNLWHDEA